MTLIELLVVIAIIITLASLSIGALMKGTEWMRRSTTENAMLKTFSAVEKRLLAIPKEADRWDTPTEILSLAGGNQRRAKVIQRKFLTKWSFPQSYREAAYHVLESDAATGSPFGYLPFGGPYPITVQIYRDLRKQLPALPGTITLATLPSAPATEAEAAAQSAACLAVIYNVLSSTDTLSGDEYGDTNGDGAFEVRDAWEQPITLLRWPTGLTHPALANRLVGYGNANNAGQDLDDPEGLLYDLTWQNSTLVVLGYSPGAFAIPGTTNAAQEIEARFHPIQRAGVVSPCFAPLTMISMGNDRRIGLLRPWHGDPGFGYPPGAPFSVPLDRGQLLPLAPAPAPSREDEFDNLYSFKLRLGSRQQ